MRLSQSMSPGTPSRSTTASAITSPNQVTSQQLRDSICSLPSGLSGINLLSQMKQRFPKTEQRYQATRLLTDYDQQYDMLGEDASLRSYLGLSNTKLPGLNRVNSSITKDKVAEALAWAATHSKTPYQERAIKRVETELKKNLSTGQTIGVLIHLVEHFESLNRDMQRQVKSNLFTTDRIAQLPIDRLPVEIQRKFHQLCNCERSLSVGDVLSSENNTSSLALQIPELHTVSSSSVFSTTSLPCSSSCYSPSVSSSSLPDTVLVPLPVPRLPDSQNEVQASESSLVVQNQALASEKSKSIALIKQKILSEGGTLLHVVAFLGSFPSGITELTTHGSQANARDNFGRTPVEVALMSTSARMPEVVGALHDAGANLVLPDVDGNTLLHRRVMAGSMPTVQLLLDRGVDANIPNMITAHRIADYAMSPKLVTDLTTRSDWVLAALNQATPLHLAAAFSNDPALIRLLLENNASVNSVTDQQATPLHLAAVCTKSPEVIKALLEGGANLEARTVFGMTPLADAVNQLAPLKNLHVLIEHGACVDTPDNAGVVPIERAILSNQLEAAGIVKALRAEGADIEIPDAEGNTLLHRSIIGGNVNATRILLDNDAKINAYSHCHSSDIAKYAPEDQQHQLSARITAGRPADLGPATPLHLAAAFGEDPEFLRILLKAGANVAQQNTKGATPLHWAAVFSTHLAVLDVLMQHEADINCKDGSGRTPLHYAVMCSNCPRVLQFLIDRGANIHARDNFQCTPLHMAAAESSQPHVVYSLIAKNADIDAKNNQKKTPLHLAAAFSQNPKIIEALRISGANVNAQESEGNTALDLALCRTDRHATEIVELLLADVATLRSASVVRSVHRNVGRISPIPVGNSQLSSEQINSDFYFAMALQESENIERIPDNVLRVQPTTQPIVPTPRVVMENWRFTSASATSKVEAFNHFQERLLETSEYRNIVTRPDFINRVNALVTAMKDHWRLRYTCFDLAAEALEACGDRIAAGLNDMELAKIDFDATRGKYSTRQLLALGEGFFKLDCVNKIALRKIAELQLKRSQIPSLPRVDEIEVRLAYQTELVERLNLPGVGRSMLYRLSAGLTTQDIDAAYAEVKEKLQSSESIQFLVQWSPWRLAIERKFVELYTKTRDVYKGARDALSIQPPRMSEQEWIDNFRKLASNEDWLLAHTHEFIAREYIREDEEKNKGAET